MQHWLNQLRWLESLFFVGCVWKCGTPKAFSKKKPFFIFRVASFETHPNYLRDIYRIICLDTFFANSTMHLSWARIWRPHLLRQALSACAIWDNWWKAQRDMIRWNKHITWKAEVGRWSWVLFLQNLVSGIVLPFVENHVVSNNGTCLLKVNMCVFAEYLQKSCFCRSSQ